MGKSRTKNHLGHQCLMAIPQTSPPQNRAASSHLQIRFYSEKERRLQNATARKKACWLGFLPVLSVDRQAKQPLCCPRALWALVGCREGP